MKRKNYGSDPAAMITPQEVCNIMEKAGDVTDIRRAVAVADEYRNRNGAPDLPNSYNLFCMLSNVYQAGRIQGIREERAARKANN